MNAGSYKQASRVVFCLMLLTIACILGTWLLLPMMNGESRGVSGEELTKEIQSMKAEFLALKQERQDLNQAHSIIRASLEQLKSQMRQGKGKGNSAEQSGHSSQAKGIDTGKEPFLEEDSYQYQLDLEERKRQAEAEMESLFVSMEDSMDKEERDSAWSDWAEFQLQEAFSAGKREGIQLQNVECKSSRCQVRMHMDSKLSVGNVLNELILSIPWSASTISSLEEGVDGNTQAVIYIARDEHSLQSLSD